ncbi:hypothetical protein LTR85_011939 [Meristemomyces frigidus]|nr:hypothetical protein LTR85_011939 [Meristemomyces frigidus]
MDSPSQIAWQELLAVSTQAAIPPDTATGALSVGNEQAERRPQLIEGVLYTRWFIVTYQAALCAVVLFFTAWHWYGKLSRRRRANPATLPTGPGEGAGIQSVLSSSSIGTVEGNATPPELAKASERSPLLSTGERGHKPGFVQIKTRALRSLAMYQPRPIPFVNKTLPANSTSLLIVLLLGLNIFYAVYKIQWEIELAFVFSDRTALLFVANLPWLYILAAKNQPLRMLTGYSYENLNVLHRRLGELLCFFAVVHGAGMIMTWYCFFRPGGMALSTFLTHRIIVLGIAAFVCYELLYVTSLASFRQWWYEVFLGTHVFLQAAGLVLVFFHHPGGRVYTALALAIFVVDRAIFRLGLKTRSVRADLTPMEDGDTVLVSADWPVVSRWSKLSTSLLGLNVKYGWKPTEHIFLTVPAMARKHVIQAHPFTIASAAPEDGQQHAWFSLIIRAHDGFSRDLVRYAHNHMSAMVRLDGPYGSLHALEMLRNSDVALLVIGGSGVAVAYPLLWTLLHDSDGEAARSGRRRVGLIWVVHEASHIAWIGHERLDELKGMGLRVCIPPPTRKAGRPDVGSLVRSSLDDLINVSAVDDPKVGVVISGPDGMSREARNICASLARHGMDTDVAVEKYGW